MSQFTQPNPQTSQTQSVAAPQCAGNAKIRTQRLLFGIGLLLAAIPCRAALAVEEPLPTATPSKAEPSKSDTASSTALQPLAEKSSIYVRSYQFKGNTVFSDSQLQKLIADKYRSNAVTLEDLEQIRIDLTKHYVDGGYINSGVLLEEQNVETGDVTYTVVEGQLDVIKIEGLKNYDPDYLTARIRQKSGRPFNAIWLQKELEGWRLGPNVAQLQAELLPGESPEQANMHLGVTESDPRSTQLEFDNYRPTSVGEYRVRLSTSNSNLTGSDDSFEAHLQLNSGGLDFSDIREFRDYSVNYVSPPLGAKGSLLDTRYTLNYLQGSSSVLEAQFQDLDISSDTKNASIGLSRELERTLNSETTLTAALEHRQSRSFLGGEPFSFAPGDDDGVAQTTAVRLGYDAVRRNERRVLAMQTLLSYGGDFPGSTHNPTSPNGRFLVLQGQAQLVQYLGDTQNQALFRLSGQWASAPLLSVEQFAVGGSGSVRGYLENQLVRDEGLVASAELRLPVKSDGRGHNLMTVVPFFDFGYAKNRSTAEITVPGGSQSLCSTGLGLICAPNSRLNAQLFYGYRLRDIEIQRHGLQSRGIHFALTWRLL